MYEVQMCRSHEKNNTPRSWETVFRGSEAEAVATYFERCRVRGASGDIYRIVDEDGEEQTVLTPTTCGPTY